MNNKKKEILGFIGLLLVGFIGNLDFSVVTVVLPSIQEHFNASLNNIMWVNIIFSLVGTSVLIPISKFGDMFGRKKILLICLSIFVISSALCGISPSLQFLILSRGLQALGASALMTISIPLVLDIFPKEKTNIIAGIWGGVSGLAVSIGPSLGGYIAQYVNWRYIFFINLPIGIIGFILIFQFVNESFDHNCNKKIDFVGCIILAMALSTFTYSLTKGNDYGFTSKRIIILFVICSISFIAFLILENTISNPIIDFSLFKIRSFTVSSSISGLIGIVSIIAFNFMSFFFKSILNYSSLESGNILFFLAFGFIISSVIAGKLASKFKISYIIFFSLIICIISIILLTSITPNTAKINFIIILFTAGLGIGAPGAQLVATAISDVPSEKNGLASGLNNIILKLFSLVLFAIMTCSLTNNLNYAFNTTKKHLIYNVSSSQIIDKNIKDIVVTKLNCLNQTNSKEILKDINLELQKNSSLPVMNNSTIQSQKQIQKYLITTMDDSQTELVKNYSKAFSNTFKIGFIFLVLALLLCPFVNPKAKRNNKY